MSMEEVARAFQRHSKVYLRKTALMCIYFKSFTVFQFNIVKFLCYRFSFWLYLQSLLSFLPVSLSGCIWFCLCLSDFNADSKLSSHFKFSCLTFHRLGMLNCATRPYWSGRNSSMKPMHQLKCLRMFPLSYSYPEITFPSISFTHSGGTNTHPHTLYSADSKWHTHSTHWRLMASIFTAPGEQEAIQPNIWRGGKPYLVLWLYHQHCASSPDDAPEIFKLFIPHSAILE